MRGLAARLWRVLPGPTKTFSISGGDVSGALDGLLILDLGQSVASAYCAKLLGDQGARVILVEHPAGSPLRRLGPFPKELPTEAGGALFLYLGAGKESITLNMEAPTGRGLFQRLATLADVVVEDFPPRALASCGLGYDELARLNPRLVMASITWFGNDGPYCNYRGSELVAHAVGGYAYLTGDPHREPLKPGGAQAQYQAGLNAAVAIMAALLERDGSGQGQHIDLSVAEAVTATFDGVPLFELAARTGTVPKRNGTRLITRNPNEAYPSTLLPCRDGYVHVHWSPANPEGIALLTGNPRLADDEVLHMPMGHADEIDALITEWLKDKNRGEAVELAQELRIPFTKVQSIPEVIDDPQNAAREFFQSVAHPAAGTVKYPRSPFRMSATPTRLGRAPLAGEHNRQIYCGLLGLSPRELVQLRQMGAI